MNNILVPKSGIETVDADYNRINIESEEDKQVAQMEMYYSKNIGHALVKHYPGRQWKVAVNLMGGVAIIACDSVSNTKGYHLHLHKYSLVTLIEAAIRAGGEILERHGLTRDKNFDSDILETLTRDSEGSVISLDSAADKA